MLYRIEYLYETTEQGTVCHSLKVEADSLEGVEVVARANRRHACERHSAEGYQIRDGSGEIVALETFDV